MGTERVPIETDNTRRGHVLTFRRRGLPRDGGVKRGRFSGRVWTA
jgi:hypothetical protein